MQLVEQHVISRRDPRYGVIDEAAFRSKNLYQAWDTNRRVGERHHHRESRIVVRSVRSSLLASMPRS